MPVTLTDRKPTTEKDDGVLAEYLCTTERDLAAEFLALDDDIVSARWRQGEIAAYIHETEGHGTLRQFAHRVGYALQTLLRLEDFHNIFEICEVDPTIPIHYYMEAAHEYAQMQRDNAGELPDYVDHPAGYWPPTAMREEWTANQMECSIRRRYGTNRTFIGKIIEVGEDNPKGLARILDGKAPMGTVFLGYSHNLESLAVITAPEGSDWGEEDKQWRTEAIVEAKAAARPEVVARFDAVCQQVVNYREVTPLEPVRAVAQVRPLLECRIDVCCKWGGNGETLRRNLELWLVGQGAVGIEIDAKLLPDKPK